MSDSERLYADLAAAYVRGSLGTRARGLDERALLTLGRAEGLRLHRFKRTTGLPRVRAVIGALHGLAPARLLDIGSGRGAFLWPLLDAFPHLEVVAVEPDARRRTHLEAVRQGGIERLTVTGSRGERLAFPDASFDVATVLEVLEHQADPLPLAREAFRVASRFVVASVPSQADDNPEHVQLFTAATLERLLRQAGAANVRVDHVLNHIVAVARTGRP